MGFRENRILVKEHIERRDFLLFLDDFPGMDLGAEAETDLLRWEDDDEYWPYRGSTDGGGRPIVDAEITEPFVNYAQAPYIQLRLVPDDEFAQIKAAGDLYYDPLGTAADNADTAEIIPQMFGGEAQSLIIMSKGAGAKDHYGDLLVAEILRAIGERWGGAYDDVYYDGKVVLARTKKDTPDGVKYGWKEETELPPRPTVPLPPPPTVQHRPRWKLGGSCENIVFSSVHIGSNEFLDFLRGFPGMYVSNWGSYDKYDGYWEAPDLKPHLSKFPVWMYVKLQDWSSVKRGHPLLTSQIFPTLCNEDALAERILERLGSEPKSMIEVHFSGEADMLGHQFACAAMRRWPGVYDTLTRTDEYDTFTVEEVAEGIRRGVHAYFVAYGYERLPPETHEEIIVVPKLVTGEIAPPVDAGTNGSTDTISLGGRDPYGDFFRYIPPTITG